MRSGRCAAALATALVVLVCTVTPAVAHTPASASGEADARSIELICGGGFTGAAGGRRIDGAGRLWQVRQPLGAARIEQPIGVDTEALRRWHAQLDAAHFERLSHHRPGNLSCTLSRNGPEGTHRITWSGSAAPTTLPAQVIRVVGELRAWTPPSSGDSAADAATPTGDAALPSNRPER